MRAGPRELLNGRLRPPPCQQPRGPRSVLQLLTALLRGHLWRERGSISGPSYGGFFRGSGARCRGDRLLDYESKGLLASSAAQEGHVSPSSPPSAVSSDGCGRMRLRDTLGITTSDGNQKR